MRLKGGLAHGCVGYPNMLSSSMILRCFSNISQEDQVSIAAHTCVLKYYLQDSYVA